MIYDMIFIMVQSASENLVHQSRQIDIYSNLIRPTFAKTLVKTEISGSLLTE